MLKLKLKGIRQVKRWQFNRPSESLCLFTCGSENKLSIGVSSLAGHSKSHGSLEKAVRVAAGSLDDNV